MNWFQALILGLVQGLTEFLPVSSSGHLVIFSSLLNIQIDEGNAFSVLLHVATFISVCIMYKTDVWMLIREAFLWIADIFRGRFKIETPERRMLIMIIYATIPAVVVGLVFKVFDLEEKLSVLPVVGCTQLLTAALMYIVDRFGDGTYTKENASPVSAWLVGLAQACALLPGLSRSGSTITAARACGYQKEFAIKFAFLMSLPAILGAAVLEGASLIKDGAFSVELLPTAIAFIAAMISGILAIKFMINLLKNNRFYIFSIYCALVGIVCLVFSFIS
ncbi:MAG: undecaprenyl-diphosphate phosphatase [Clostridia bacterium]|nr:undecaprenyl-diphosphate phosphatase [Clostridia bacterium]